MNKPFSILLVSILYVFLFFAETSAIEIPDKIKGISVPKPTAEIVNFDIDSISLYDITFLFDIAITNPYPVKLSLSKVKADFYVENKQFFKTETDKLNIKAKGKEITRVFVNIKYADMAGIVKDYANKDMLECLIDVVIVLPLPKSVQSISKDVTFSFKLKKNVPTIKPEISIANFTVKEPSLDEIKAELKRKGKKNINADSVKNMLGALLDGKSPEKVIDPADLDLKIKVNFDINLKNKTKSSLVFKDLNYNFNVNAASLVSGQTKDIQNKPGEYILRVTNEFSSKALGTAIMKAFKDKKGNYTLNGYSMVKFPDEIRKDPVKLKFNENGLLNMK
jgi:LEA14-like dessication related protein